MEVELCFLIRCCRDLFISLNVDITCKKSLCKLLITVDCQYNMGLVEHVPMFFFQKTFKDTLSYWLAWKPTTAFLFYPELGLCNISKAQTAMWWNLFPLIWWIFCLYKENIFWYDYKLLALALAFFLYLDADRNHHTKEEESIDLFLLMCIRLVAQPFADMGNKLLTVDCMDQLSVHKVMIK